MDGMYFLKTKRLEFSKWTPSYLALARRLWGNEQVTRWICAGGRFDEGEIAARLALEIENDKEYGVQYWPLFECASGEFVGCYGLRPHGTKAGEYELGFHLLPAFWGRGYAVEAAQAVIAYAFLTLNADSLFAGHRPENKKSARALTKLGFTYVGDEFYAPSGLYHPSYARQRADRI